MKTPVVPPISNFSNSIKCKVDSGATCTYIREEDKNILNNITKEVKQRAVILPNNTSVKIKENGILNTKANITNKGKKASIVPGLKSASLLSVGTLCDDECRVNFDKEKVQVIKNEEVILEGNRCVDDGLWEIEFDASPKLENVNMLIPVKKTKSELANYLHAAMFSPAITTLQKAIRNNQLLTFPGIDQIDYLKFIVDSIAIPMGKIKQERKFLRSTKKQKVVIKEERDYDCNPIAENKQFCLVSNMFEFSPKEMAYGDMTGRFPHKSSRGNQYIYVLYDYDSNMICVKAIPNRQGNTIKKCWEELYHRITKNGHQISHFILDNELS